MLNTLSVRPNSVGEAAGGAAAGEGGVGKNVLMFSNYNEISLANTKVIKIDFNLY